MSFETLDCYNQFARSVRNIRAPLDAVAREFLTNIRKTMAGRDVELNAESNLFRAQFGTFEYDGDEDGGPQIYGYGEDRMRPRLEYITPGRCNQANQVVLYLASSEETAVSELRPWIGQDISLGVFSAMQKLRLADLSKGHGEQCFQMKQLFELPISECDQPYKAPSQDEINQYVWFDIDKAFSKPVTRMDVDAEYAPTQILSELFRNMGYGGVIYKSHFGEERGYNVAIFDPMTFIMKKTTPLTVKKISVEYDQIGNPSFMNVDPT